MGKVVAQGREIQAIDRTMNLEAGLRRRRICSTERVVKSPKFILLLSLLNLGVVAGILVYVFRPSPTTMGTSEAVDSLTVAAPAQELVAHAGEKIVVVTNQFHWAQIESEDYKTYIARLRSIGCPEPTIRDIISGAGYRKLNPLRGWSEHTLVC